MKSYKIYLSFIVLFFVTLSCEDQLELEPEQSLSVGESLADIEGIQTALLGAYDGFQSVSYYGRNFVIIPEVAGDNVYVSINNSNRFLQSYRYELIPNNGDFTGFWNQGYDVIARANNIINNIEGVEASEQQKNQVLGEALAIRALAHFDLVRFFAVPYADGPSQLGVPIVLESVIAEPARNTIEEVYQQVIADLTQAQSLLSNAEGPFRFTSNAATALLARVYLYKEDWTNAASAASTVISSGDYEITPAENLEDFFLTSGNPEEIFTINRRPDETLGADNLGQIYNPQGYGDIRVTSDIREEYVEEDIRTELYYEQGGEFYVGKFLGEQGVPGLVGYKVLRLSEMYMIRAEARAELDDFDGALEDLNAVRENREVEDLDLPDSEVLEAVYVEKNREFAFEGHRSFDLWRTGRPLTRQQCNTGIELSAPCFIEADSYLRAYPIPQRELDVNQNMVQNPGY